MDSSQLLSLLSPIISLVGVIISYVMATNKVKEQMRINQELMQAELKHLQDDVKEHNHYAKLFAESMPVVKEQIKVINHRISDLEDKNK